MNFGKRSWNERPGPAKMCRIRSHCHRRNPGVIIPGVWTRQIFMDEYGLDSSKVTWVVDDEEHVEALKLPPNVVHTAPDKSLAGMMASGELDAGLAGGSRDRRCLELVLVLLPPLAPAGELEPPFPILCLRVNPWDVVHRQEPVEQVTRQVPHLQLATVLRRDRTEDGEQAPPVHDTGLRGEQVEAARGAEPPEREPDRHRQVRVEDRDLLGGETDVPDGDEVARLGHGGGQVDRRTDGLEETRTLRATAPLGRVPLNIT